MEERAIYEACSPKPMTFRDLRWLLDLLRPDELDSPALVVVGSGVFVVSELAADGPVLLVENHVRREDLHGED